MYCGPYKGSQGRNRQSTDGHLQRCQDSQDISIEQGTALDKCQNEYCYVLTNDPCRNSILKHRVIKKVTYQCIKKLYISPHSLQDKLGKKFMAM